VLVTGDGLYVNRCSIYYKYNILYTYIGFAAGGRDQVLVTGDG
jgi:hypothetical protein